MKGCALAASGNADRARAIQRRLKRGGPGIVVSPYHLAALSVALGEPDAALEQLGCACRIHDTWVDALGVDPRFASLRGDPRFAALRARLQLG